MRRSHKLSRPTDDGAASEDAELDAAKNARFAGVAPKKKKKTGGDATLDAANGSLFAGAKPGKQTASIDEDAVLAEAKGRWMETRV